MPLTLIVTHLRNAFQTMSAEKSSGESSNDYWEEIGSIKPDRKVCLGDGPSTTASAGAARSRFDILLVLPTAIHGPGGRFATILR